jgi:hypothetical protein
MKLPAPRYVVALAACIVAFSCGSIPTLADGIAYISPIQLPALAVAAGDTLRDSLGRVAPLRVNAFDTKDDTIPGVVARYVVSTLPAGVKVDTNGIVTAFDSLRTVQIVGRVGDHLQTAPSTLEVVAQPDLMAATGNLDSLVVNTPSSALQINITGNRSGTRVPVNGIVVRYRIVSPVVPDTILFFTEGVRGDLSRTRDTTSAGVTSRTIIATSTAGFPSVIEVQATANNLKGVALPGSPVRFLIPVKKGP